MNNGGDIHCCLCLKHFTLDDKTKEVVPVEEKKSVAFASRSSHDGLLAQVSSVASLAPLEFRVPNAFRHATSSLDDDMPPALLESYLDLHDVDDDDVPSLVEVPAFASMSEASEPPPLVRCNRDCPPPLLPEASFRRHMVPAGENPVSAALLKGWTMLEKSCPSCYQPFMQEPKQGAKWCVQCNTKIVPASASVQSNTKIVPASQSEARHKPIQAARRHNSPAPLLASSREDFPMLLMSSLMGAESMPRRRRSSSPPPLLRSSSSSPPPLIDCPPPLVPESDCAVNRLGPRSERSRHCLETLDTMSKNVLPKLRPERAHAVSRLRAFSMDDDDVLLTSEQKIKNTRSKLLESLRTRLDAAQDALEDADRDMDMEEMRVLMEKIQLLTATIRETLSMK